jgi:hypothetical protein
MKKHVSESRFKSRFSSLKGIILFSFIAVVSVQELKAQCPGTSIDFNWGVGTVYTYQYDGIRNGKCAYKQASPGTTIEWTGTQWNIYGNASYSGTAFWHSTVDVGDRPSGFNSDWVADMGLAMNSLTGTGVILACSNPTFLSTTPNIICGTGSVDLVATTSAGNVDWYTTPTGGTSLFTGSNFTTPSISTTTTYYAEASNGACVNPVREAVVASISNNCTQVRLSQCGTTVINPNDAVWAPQVAGATNYKFEITDPSNNVTFLEGTARNFKFSQFAFTNNMTYHVRVAAKVGGVYSPFGTSCDVHFEYRSKIQTSQCGATITSPNTQVFAREVANATAYKFELTDESYNVTFIENPTRTFKFNQFAYIPGETYSIRVSPKTGSVYGHFGVACNVTAPATAARPEDAVELKNMSESTFDFEAFPNPSNGDFTISSSEVGTFNIINELGQVIRTVEITEANGNQVNVENMPNGAYFVTGTLNGEAVTKKVMVVR